MCKGKICPNFDNCKCNTSESGTPEYILNGVNTVLEITDYTSEKYKDLIPSTTSPHWKGNSVEEEGSFAQGDVIFNLFIGDE